MHVSHNKILYECISLGQQLWQTLISSFPLVQNVIMSVGCMNMIPVSDFVEPICQLHRRHLHDPFSFTNPPVGLSMAGTDIYKSSFFPQTLRD